MISPIPRKYLTTEEIRERFHPMSVTTLWRWQEDRGFPKPAISGRPNRWLISDVEAWEEQQRSRDSQTH